MTVYDQGNVHISVGIENLIIVSVIELRTI